MKKNMPQANLNFDLPVTSALTMRKNKNNWYYDYGINDGSMNLLLIGDIAALVILNIIGSIPFNYPPIAILRHLFWLAINNAYF